MGSSTAVRVAFALAFLAVAGAFVLAANGYVATTTLAQGGANATVTDVAEVDEGETIAATVRLHNPTRADLDVVGAEGIIYLRGRIVTTSAETDRTTVPAGETRELTVYYAVSPGPYGDDADALGTDEMVIRVALDGRVVRAPIKLRVSQRGLTDG